MTLTKGEWRNIRRGLIFTAPWILGLLLFVVYPIGASFYYSFTDFNVLLPAVPVGFTNYTDLLKDDLFCKSFRNTIVFTLLALPLSLALALFIAILLNEGIKCRGFFRTIYSIPSLVPLGPLGILWQLIFNSQYGVLNVFLEGVLDPLGMSAPNWLGDPFWTKPALVITRMWVVGGAIIIFLAALQDVPRQYYESAELDGASSFHKFRHITLPFISPAIYFNLIIGMIACILAIVAIVYLCAIGYLGFRGYKATRSASDYLVAGRKIHPYVMALSYGATFISTSAIIGFGGAAALFGIRGRLAGDFVGFLGILGVGLHRCGQLFNRGRSLLQVGRLLGGAAGKVLRCGRQLLARRGHLLGRILDASHHIAQVF